MIARARTPTLEMALGAVAGVLARRGIDDIAVDAATTFEQLGFDSLDLVEVFVQLEDLLGASLDPRTAERARCVADLTQIAAARVA